MFDKLSPEAAQASAAFMLAVIVSFLGVLVEQPRRSWRYQFVDVTVCGFFGLAAFFVCTAMGLHIFLAYTASIFIGKIGVLQTTLLIEKLVNKKL